MGMEGGEVAADSVMKADRVRPDRDPLLEGKFCQACYSLDELLSDLEQLNLHAPDVAKYMGRIMEVSEELAYELKRLKTRVIEPCMPKPILKPILTARARNRRTEMTKAYQRRGAAL